MELPMYSICPISPDRIILLAANGVIGAPKSVSVFSNEFLKEPKLNPNKNVIMIRVKKCMKMK